MWRTCCFGNPDGCWELKKQSMKHLSSPAGFSVSRIFLILALCASGSVFALAGLTNRSSAIDRRSGLNKGDGAAVAALLVSSQPGWATVASPNALTTNNNVYDGRINK